MTEEGRSTCPVCGRSVFVEEDGTVEPHIRRGSLSGSMCQGGDRQASSAACPMCGGEQSVSALGDVICENGCHKEPSAATTERPFSEPVCFGYCGNLQWTVEKHGRVTHKAMCPRRTEPWCQSHPTGCPSDCQAIGSRARL